MRQHFDKDDDMKLIALIRNMFSAKRKQKESDDITKKVFGNVVKFRLGSTVSISDSLLLTLREDSAIKEIVGDASLSSMTVRAIFEFTFDGLKVYRLHCTNPDCIVQIQETAYNGMCEYMIFFLVNETYYQTMEEYKSHTGYNQSTMSDSHIYDSNNNKYERIFGPLTYEEIMLADTADNLERPDVSPRKMAFHSDGVEHILQDAEDRLLLVETFCGVDVPSQDIKII